MSLELRDGSVVRGRIAVPSISWATAIGPVSVPFADLTSLRLDGEGGTATAVFKNGDRLSGKPGVDRLGVRMLLGERTIPLSLIKSMARAGEFASRAGLVLYYSFDTDEGNKVTDLSDMHNDGVVHGAQWVPDGKRGGAYAFSGRREHILTPDSDSLDLTTGLTVIAWIKVSAPADGAGWEGIVTKGNEADRNYSLERNRGTKALGLYMHDGQGKWALNSRQDLTLDRWHMLAVTWDGTRATLFVDGEDAADPEGPGNFGASWSEPLHPNRLPLKIGAISDVYPYTYFNDGLIDEVMIFDHALSAEEIGVLHGY